MVKTSSKTDDTCLNTDSQDQEFNDYVKGILNDNSGRSREINFVNAYLEWLNVKPEKSMSEEARNRYATTRNKTIFVDMAGDFVAGAVLSQVSFWTLEPGEHGGRRCSDPDGWLAKSDTEWFDEMRLSPSEVAAARKKLIKAGLIETCVRQWNGHPTRHYRIKSRTFFPRWLSAMEGVVVRPKRERSRPDVAARNAGRVKFHSEEQNHVHKQGKAIPIDKAMYSHKQGNGIPLFMETDFHKQGNLTETSAETTDRDFFPDFPETIIPAHDARRQSEGTLPEAACGLSQEEADAFRLEEEAEEDKAPEPEQKTSSLVAGHIPPAMVELADAPIHEPQPAPKVDRLSRFKIEREAARKQNAIEEAYKRGGKRAVAALNLNDTLAAG